MKIITAAARNFSIVQRRRVEIERQRLASKRQHRRQGHVVAVAVIDHRRRGVAVAAAVLRNNRRRPGVSPSGDDRRQCRRTGRAGTAKGLDGAAHAAGGGSPVLVKPISGAGVEPVIGKRIAGVSVEIVVKGRREGEISLRLWSSEVSGCGVVRTRRLFGGVECSKPHPGLLQRVSDLGGEPAPWSFSHAPVSRLFEKNRPRTGLDRCRRRRGGASPTHLQRSNLFRILRRPRNRTGRRW